MSARVILGLAAGIGLAILYAFLLAPLVVVVLASLSGGEVLAFPPQGLSLKWFARFFGHESFRNALWLSLQVAVISTLVVSVVATMAALFQRGLGRRLAGPFRTLLLMPLLMPEILTAIGLLFFLYQIGLGNTYLGLQIGHIVITLPFAFLSITSALDQVDPALEEASASLGAGYGRTAWKVMLPLIKPGIITGGLFTFIVSFDMFAISFLLKTVGGNTLPLALFDYLKYDFDPTAAAAATVSIIFALGVVALVEKLVGLRRAF